MIRCHAKPPNNATSRSTNVIAIPGEVRLLLKSLGSGTQKMRSVFQAEGDFEFHCILALGEGACVGVGALGGGSSAGIAFATLVGPIGWAVVGCKNDDRNGDSGYTWDCWKPVVRDTSTRPSGGMTLRCLAAHPNVQSMLVDQGRLFVENIFGERFHLTPVTVKGGLAFHASILSS